MLSEVYLQNYRAQLVGFIIELLPVVTSWTKRVHPTNIIIISFNLAKAKVDTTTKTDSNHGTFYFSYMQYAQEQIGTMYSAEEKLLATQNLNQILQHFAGLSTLENYEFSLPKQSQISIAKSRKNNSPYKAPALSQLYFFFSQYFKINLHQFESQADIITLFEENLGHKEGFETFIEGVIKGLKKFLPIEFEQAKNRTSLDFNPINTMYLQLFEEKVTTILAE